MNYTKVCNMSGSTGGSAISPLFDENMQIVMIVYTGDSWVGSTKGYFHVAYYPEGGGSAADTTGYIYSSIHRTGKLWVHNGNVQYDIEGVQSGNLGAVDNPHRTIKYIVIRAQRSGYYTLSDLRLHNIKVCEGLDTTSAPMYADGTTKGTITQESEEATETDVMGLWGQISVYWIGLWPVFHIVRLPQSFNGIEGAPETSIHITKELHEQKYRVQSVEFPGSETSPQGFDITEIIETAVIDIGALFFVGVTASLWNALEKATFAGFFTVAYPAAILSLIFTMLYPLGCISAMVQSGLWTYDWAAVALIFLGISILLPFVALIIGAWGQMLANALAGISLASAAVISFNAITSILAPIVLVLLAIWFILVGLDMGINGV